MMKRRSKSTSSTRSSSYSRAMKETRVSLKNKTSMMEKEVKERTVVKVKMKQVTMSMQSIVLTKLASSSITSSSA